MTSNGNSSRNGDYRVGYGKPPKEHQFQPGNPGGPGGPRRSVTGEIKRLLEEGVEGKDLMKALAEVAAKKALKGDFRFFNLIQERTEGKVPDRIAGHDGGPLMKAYVGIDVERAGAAE